MRVKVRDDASMYAEMESGPPYSTRAGKTGTVVPNHQPDHYDLAIWFDDEGPIPEDRPIWGHCYLWREVEVLDGD